MICFLSVGALKKQMEEILFTKERARYPKYDSLFVTTRTYVVFSNLKIDKPLLFGAIECAALKHPLGTKKMMVNDSENLEDGDIVCAEYQGIIKGRSFQKRKKQQMLNCVTVIMKVGSDAAAGVLGDDKRAVSKFYNIKISDKGRIQITGCTSERPVYFIISRLWNMLLSIKGAWEITDIFPSAPPETVVAFSTSVMNNCSFNLGFVVDRELLNSLIKIETEYISIFESSDNYSAVNIKISSRAEDLQDLMINKYLFDSAGEGTVVRARYDELLDTLSEKERARKLTLKSYMNTFLVFDSGSVISVGVISPTNYSDAYEKFISMIIRFRKKIEVLTVRAPE